MSETTNTGKVKFFNGTKGYGFIVRDDSEPEIFFHINNVKDRMQLGQDDRVEFDVENTKKGLAAINVIKIAKN